LVVEPGIVRSTKAPDGPVGELDAVGLVALVTMDLEAKWSLLLIVEVQVISSDTLEDLTRPVVGARLVRVYVWDVDREHFSSSQVRLVYFIA
jgi:hypothetical protein